MKKFLAIFLAVMMLALACVATVSAEEKVNVMFYDPEPYRDPSTGEIDWTTWEKELNLASGVANTKGAHLNLSMSYTTNWGYSLGMARMLDGILSSDPDVNPLFFEYRLLNLYNQIDAYGTKKAGDYVAWFGYQFLKPVTCDSFEIYFRDDGNIAGLAILGGTLHDDGSVTWTELAREANLNNDSKTSLYDGYTRLWKGDFTNGAATMDMVRIAYLPGSQTYTFLSEFRMFQVAGAAPVETTTAPVETTAAPVETTAAPVETTAAPVETTAAPVVTTAAPVVTTAAPVNTTAPTQTPDTADVSMIVVMVAALALTAVVVLRRRARD